MIEWDGKKNTFKVAQWLKGRIYERRSDISPSGKHWIYFAMNGKWNAESKGAWTAIARAPWLKAIVMHPKGDFWNGGGLFLNDKSYWLNDGYGHEQILNSSEIKRDEKYSPLTQYGGECLHVYYNRLQRDGWEIKDQTEHGKWLTETVFEKLLPKNWTFRKICHSQIDSTKGKGCYWDEHEIVSESGELSSMQRWEWAELVGDAVYYAEKGCLFRIKIQSSNKLGLPKLLHDFNGYKYENNQAPY